MEEAKKERARHLAIQSSLVVVTIGGLLCLAGAIMGLRSLAADAHPPVFGYGLLIIVIAYLQRLVAAVEDS